MSNVEETVQVSPLEVSIYGSGFRTSVNIQTRGSGEEGEDEGYTSAYAGIYITPKQARKLAKALRASAKLREKK